MVASESAARSSDHAVERCLAFRADTGRRLAALLAADADMCMAHVLKGYLALLPLDAAFVPRAREALAHADRLAAHSHPGGLKYRDESGAGRPGRIASAARVSVDASAVPSCRSPRAAAVGPTRLSASRHRTRDRMTEPST